MQLQNIKFCGCVDEKPDYVDNQAFFIKYIQIQAYS